MDGLRMPLLGIVDRRVVYRPVHGSPGDTVASLRLDGVDTPVCFGDPVPAPFEAAIHFSWHKHLEEDTPGTREADERLYRALWLVESVIQQQKASRADGRAYLARSEARCSVPAPGGEGLPPPEGLPAPVPVLVVFGWVYPLRRHERGNMVLHGRRYLPTTPLPVARWWLLFTQQLDAMFHEATSRSPGQHGDLIQRTISAFRKTTRGRDETILHQDAALKVTWRRADGVFIFQKPFQAYCLEDRHGRLHFFTGGWVVIREKAAFLSRFTDRPSGAFPSVIVQSDPGGGLNPFVHADDGRLCDDGHARKHIGLNPDLSAGGMILETLDAAVRTIMTGGGNVSHHGFQNLESTHRDLISPDEASGRNLPVFRWDIAERGKEELVIGPHQV